MSKLILDPFFGTKSFDKMVELSESFNKEIFNPKDVGVTYTNINYWDKKGILSSHRKNESQWRNFTFIDYVWIKVIIEMRSMGVPVEIIKAAKNILFRLIDLQDLIKKIKTNTDKVKALTYEKKKTDSLIKLMQKAEKMPSEEGVTHFFMSVATAILQKTPVSIILGSDKSLMIWSEFNSANYSEESRKFKILGTYINISISKIIKDFLLDKKSVFLLPELQLLQPNEIRIMELIHAGNYDSISIHFRDKKMKELELKKEHDTKMKMVDILTQGSYQEIRMKTHKGMVTTIENTIKVILD